MGSVNIHSLPIVCRASDLSILIDQTWATSTHVILNHGVPFSVSVTLTFENSNAIALLALAPTIQVDFYATPLQSGNTVNLGTSQIPGESQQTVYTPQLDLAAPANLELLANQVYRLGALVRIGALHQPAILCGVVDDLMMQVYTAPASEPSSQSQRRSGKATP